MADEGNVTYQIVQNPLSNVDKIIIETAPHVIKDKLWAFMGVDIQLADVQEYDFDNLLDMVDIKFLNMLKEVPERKWNDMFLSIKYRNREGVNSDYIISIMQLWSDAKAKIYQHAMRGRGGFTMNAVSRSRSENVSITQDKTLENFKNKRLGFI